MNYLFSTILLLFLMACQPSVEDTVKDVVTQTKPEKTVKVNQQNAVADTLPPYRNNTYYLKDKARPIAEIQETFPYDISITSPDGEKLNSSKALRANGKPTVLLFWLTTCYTCRIELEVIKKNYEAWQKETDFNLFAISTDFPMNYDKFVAMVEKNNWPFPALHDTNREFRKILPGGLNGLPQTFIISPDGEIVFHKRKYLTGDEIKLYDKIKEIAAQ